MEKSMTPQDFCYWLQGFFELSETKNISDQQAFMIKEHLKLVFNNVIKNEQSEIIPLTDDCPDSFTSSMREAFGHFDKQRPPNKYC